MKLIIIVLILLSSVLGFGQAFEVSDFSESASPVSFSGMAKVSETGTTCAVTLHNNSSQSLLAIVVSGEVTSPWGWMQPTGVTYDGFFKETGIAPGQDFDLVDANFFMGRIYENGVLVEPKKDLVCHARFKVQFFQLQDGSISGDYQVQKNLMAEREKSMALLTRLVQAYDSGGEAAFAAALNEPESKDTTDLLEAMSKFFKIPMIDLARKRLAYAEKRQASGIF
jgi:hypothetical protein